MLIEVVGTSRYGHDMSSVCVERRVAAEREREKGVAHRNHDSLDVMNRNEHMHESLVCPFFLTVWTIGYHVASVKSASVPWKSLVCSDTTALAYLQMSSLLLAAKW